MTAVHEYAKPRKRAEGHPILIPPSGPTPYVSFRRALNLCLPDEGSPQGEVRQVVTDNRRSHRTGQGTDLERVMREVVARVQDASFALRTGVDKHPSWKYLCH